jgi:hypothetical protein
VALLQTRVSREITRAKEQLKSWEKQYFTKHCKLPSSQDMLSNHAAKQLVDKIRYSKTIFTLLKGENFFVIMTIMHELLGIFKNNKVHNQRWLSAILIFTKFLN